MELGVIVKFGGDRPLKLIQTVLSIMQGGVAPNEIIIIGAVRDIHQAPIINQCTLIESDAAYKGALGKMINTAVRSSNFEYLLVCDDDIFFPDLFFEKLYATLQNKADVLTFGIINTDGSRYWDSAVHGKHHMLAPFGWHSSNSYLTGGAFVAKRKVLIEIPFSEELLIGQGEDVDWSKRLISSHFTWQREYGLQVLHNDGQCYQNKNVVQKSKDPSRLIAYHRANYTKGEVFIEKATLDFSQHHDVAGIILDGWHEPENWGVWASSPSSTLKFKVKRGITNITINYRLPSLIQSKEKLGIRIIETESNSIHIESTSNKKGCFSLSISSEIISGEYKSVFLHFDNSSFINKEKKSSDSRRLGIGIEKIELWSDL